MPQLFRRRIVIVVMAIVFLAIDHVMGPYITFPIAFVIPIAITAWWHGRVAGIILATLMTLARFFWTSTWELPIQNLMAYMVINALIREIVFILMVLLIHRVAVQQRALEREVKVLEGMLPICSYCKQIRDDEGQWEQMETYITKRSEAEFSHSICPPCREQYFGRLRKSALT